MCSNWMIGQEIILCWLGVSTNNIINIIIVLILIKVEERVKNFLELIQSRFSFGDCKIGNTTVFYFFFPNEELANKLFPRLPL